MNVSDLYALVINPVLQAMGGKYNDPRARRLLAAIAEQESGLIHREQFPTGPAHGLWQFERGGGVTGVMNHRATRTLMKEWCLKLLVPFEPFEVHNAITLNDQLACVAARLLLYTHPDPLPTDEATAWTYYENLWRPGKPRPRDWPESWAISK